MSQEMIRINVELEGLEPSRRMEAALDELCAAAADMVEDAEVSGFGGVMGDEPAMVRWQTPRPDVKSFNLGMPPATKYYDGAGNHIRQP